MRWSWKRPSLPKQYRQWFQENYWWILIVIAFIIAIAFWRGEWLPWVGFRGKTLWDWLSLLGVPLSLAILGYILQQQQQQRADEEAQEEILQVYFDRLSTLLVDKNLLAIAVKLDALSKGKVSSKSDEVSIDQQELFATAVDVVRARTLSILRRFSDNPSRKTSVVRFLIEAGVVSKARLNLSGADLSGADLTFANLSGVNLSDANLSGVNFSSADLSFANLGGAKFYEANLSFANLSGAKLYEANLNSVDLSFANLRDAKLYKVNLSASNLARASFWDADLIEADLRSASLDNTNLRGANLSNAKWNEYTRWPVTNELSLAYKLPHGLKHKLGIE